MQSLGSFSSSVGRTPSHPSHRCQLAAQTQHSPAGGRGERLVLGQPPSSSLATYRASSWEREAAPQHPPQKVFETFTLHGGGLIAPERVRESVTGQGLDFELDFELLAWCPFPHTRLGSQLLAGGGIFDGAGSKQDFFRGGPVIQRGPSAVMAGGPWGMGRLLLGLSKSIPVLQVCTPPLSSG